VLDVAAVSAVAHAQPWQTMGWQNFLIYEIHARRFTNLLAAGCLASGASCRRRNAGHHNGLTVHSDQLGLTRFPQARLDRGEDPHLVNLRMFSFR